MRCPCCDKDQWKNIDHLRLKKEGLAMCEGCGFTSYPGKIKSEEEIKEYYRKEYRPAPQAHNLFTGERKLQYHASYLAPLFEEWKKAGITKPVVGEIGSAMGMFLNWFKQTWPEAEVHGTELTESFRRVAFHEYGLNLKEDFDTTKKYDLIVSYHVLEHQAEPDKKLAEYAACLKDSGLFYLSCPIWFRDATSGSSSSFDIEYYWAPDHINCWSEEHLEHIFKKAGLAIIAKDTQMYGNTYLLKKITIEVPELKLDYKDYLKKAEDIFKCWQMLQENRSAEAIAAYKNCPAAWIAHCEINRAKLYKDKEAFDKFFKDALEACPNSIDMYIYAGEVHSRHERYGDAISFFESALNKKPNNPNALMGIANCYRMRAKREADEIKKIELYKKAVNVNRFVMATSTELLPQALSWVYQDSSNIPLPR